MAAKQKEKVIVEIVEENGSTPIEIEILSKHYEFCLLYVMKYRLNAKKAYMDVYPDAKPESAIAAASKVLTDINVLKVAKHLMRQKIISAEATLLQISDLTESSLEPFLNYGDGRQDPYLDLSQESAKENIHFVKEMEMTRERRLEGKGEDEEEWEVQKIKIKVHDRKEALRDMAKHHKLLTDRVEQAGFNIEIPWDDLTPEQIARLNQGVDPAIIKKEVDDAKSKNTN